MATSGLLRHWSTMADTLPKVETETLGDTRCDAQVLVDTLPDTLSEVEAVTLCDRLSDSQALVENLV